VVEQKMDAPLKKKCPECGKYKLYQDLSGQHTFVYQECKTLGHQAQRNTERMGKYDLEMRRKRDSKVEQAKKRSKKSWYNPEGKDLKTALAPLSQSGDPKKIAEAKHKYIMEGK
jgi:hypothetical protein